MLLYGQQLHGQSQQIELWRIVKICSTLCWKLSQCLISKEEKIVVATDLVNSVTEKCNLKNFKILKNFQGEFLKDTICEHPFNKLGFDYNVPLLDANFVNLEQGTGLVHCAPSHGLMILIFA